MTGLATLPPPFCGVKPEGEGTGFEGMERRLRGRSRAMWPVMSW